MMTKVLKIDPEAKTVEAIELDLSKPGLHQLGDEFLHGLDYGNRVIGMKAKRGAKRFWQWAGVKQKFSGTCLIIGKAAEEFCNTMITVAEAEDTVKFTSR